MTLAEELGTIRNSIKEVDKDSIISDSLLYSYWKKARAVVIGNELTRTNKLPEIIYKQYCLQLSQIKSVDCDCPELVNAGCDILQSTVNIPEYIENPIKDTLQIYTLGYERIGLTTLSKIKSDKLDEIKKTKARAIIPNRKLQIWNDLGKTRVYIRMIPADPMDWAELPVCNPTTGEVYCPDVMNEDAGLTEKMSERVLMLILDKYFKGPAQLPDDRSQDRNTNTN